MTKFKNLNTRELSQQDQDELFQRIELLTSSGKQVEATSPLVDISKRPEYFDETRFDSAQKTVNKYYLGLGMSSSIGLMLLLQLEEILIPLLKTGKSRTVPDLYDRYSATAKYIKRCYESRFYEPDSEGWRLVGIVRSMHQRIFKIMNGDEQSRSLIPESERSNQQYVWVNQYDMALTQFAFIGLFILRPDKCGAPNISGEELGEVVYFWRLFSYQFGIEERFNLFVYHDDLAKQKRFLELLFDEYKQRLAKPRNQIGVRMSEGFLLSFESLSEYATMNIVENHWFEVISLTGRKELATYAGLGELWKLARFRLINNLSSSSDIARQIIVTMYKKKLEKFCSDGDKIKKKLRKKYPNHVYELDAKSQNVATGSR